jgi:hypothetical protein
MQMTTKKQIFPNIYFDYGLNNSTAISEIQRANDKRKNGKATGLDQVTNEYIKGSSTLLIPLHHKFLTCILNSVFLPNFWLAGCIVPIYKSKSNIEMPENYRPITLLSCLGK